MTSRPVTVPRAFSPRCGIFSPRAPYIRARCARPAQVLGAVTRAFSAVLAHLDRNSGLRLLGEESARDGDWADLFNVRNFFANV